MSRRMELETLVLHLAGEASHLEHTIHRVENELKGAQKRLSRLGTQLSLSVTAPLAAIGAFGIHEFSKFDDAMTQSLAIMGDSADQYRDKMEKVAKEISSRSITSATELAESYYFLASAGYTAAESIENLATVERFAVAGRFNMARATELLADSQAALGLKTADFIQSQKEMERVANVLVRANTLANASVEQFAIALTSKAAASAKLLGMEVEELVSILAVYANQGVKAELAGNRVNIMLRDLQTAALENATAFEAHGIRVYEEATGEFRRVADIIRDLTQATEGMSDAQKKLMLLQLGFTDRSMIATQAMMGQSDAMEEMEQKLKEIGFLQEVYDRQLQSFSARMTILGNNVENAAKLIGEDLAPHVLALTQSVRTLTDWWAELDSETRSVIVTVGLFAGSVGPALLGLSLFYSTGRFVVRNLTEMRAGLASAAKAYVAHKTALVQSAMARAAQQQNAAISEAYYQTELAKTGAAVTATTATETKTAATRRGLYLTTTATVEASNARIVASHTAMIAAVNAAGTDFVLVQAKIGSSAIIAAAQVDAASKRIVASMIFVQSSAGAASVAGAAGMRRITGPTMQAAGAASVLDAKWTMAGRKVKSSDGAIKAAGRNVTQFGTSTSRTAAVLSAFRFELALLVGFLTYRFVSALNGATEAYNRWERSQEEGDKLQGKAIARSQDRQSAVLEEAAGIQDLAKRQEFLNKELVKAEKHWNDETKWIEASKKAIEERKAALKGEIFGAAQGFFPQSLAESLSYELSLDYDQLEDAREEAETAHKNVQELRNALEALEKDKEKKTAAEAEQVSVDAVEMQKALELELETMGMSTKAVALYKLAKQGLDPVMEKELKQLIATVEAKQKELEVDEQRRSEQEAATQEREHYIEALEQEASVLGKTGREAELYRMQLKGLKGEEAEFAKMLVEQIDNHEKQQEAMDRGRQLMEEMRSPLERLNDEIADLTSLKDLGAIDTTTFERAIEKAKEEYEAALQDEEKEIRVKMDIQGPDTLSREGLFRDLFGQVTGSSDLFKSALPDELINPPQGSARRGRLVGDAAFRRQLGEEHRTSTYLPPEFRDQLTRIRRGEEGPSLVPDRTTQAATDDERDRVFKSMERHLGVISKNTGTQVVIEEADIT